MQPCPRLWLLWFTHSPRQLRRYLVVHHLLSQWLLRFLCQSMVQSLCLCQWQSLSLSQSMCQ